VTVSCQGTLPSIYIKGIVLPSLTKFASMELFLVFHNILTVAVLPEVILRRDPGIRFPFCGSTAFEELVSA
jgi:hypothetical protein